mgnify:CR=1 FL=1|jgi:hypothetical protein
MTSFITAAAILAFLGAVSAAFSPPIAIKTKPVVRPTASAFPRDDVEPPLPSRALRAARTAAAATTLVPAAVLATPSDYMSEEDEQAQVIVLTGIALIVLVSPIVGIQVSCDHLCAHYRH